MEQLGRWGQGPFSSFAAIALIGHVAQLLSAIDQAGAAQVAPDLPSVDFAIALGARSPAQGLSDALDLYSHYRGNSDKPAEI